MATNALKFIDRAPVRGNTPPASLCHFTTVHTSLKARSFHRECMPLAAAGIDVRFVAPLKSAGPRDGVTLVRHARRATLFGRIAAIPGLLVKLLRQRAGVYHFQDPQLLPLALALKLVFRKRVIYDAYEDFPSMAANKRSLPPLLRSFAARIVASLESCAARAFDGIVTADPLTLRRLRQTGTSRKLVFYNFPNLDFFPPPRPCAKRFDVVYRGGISERAGIYDLLAAMEQLAASGRPARLLLLGYFDNAAGEAAVRGRIRSLGLDARVEIRGRIDHENMAAALSEARVGVSPLRAVPKFLLNIPVKVFEYWACGLPVVSTDLPPIRPFFRNDRSGLLVPPGDSASLVQAIARLLDHPEEASQMGALGRELIVERLNNAREVHKLRRFVAQIAEAG